MHQRPSNPSTRRGDASLMWRAGFAAILSAVLASSTTLLTSTSVMAQEQSRAAYDTERLVRTLRPASGSRTQEPEYTNRIIQTNIPLPGGKSQTVSLNYNHSVDLSVYFRFDSAAITPRGAAWLDQLGRALSRRELLTSRYLIAGHTDAKGSRSYNQRLSERRALAVSRYLYDRFDVDADQLIAVGYGESKLADPTRPRSGVNRRVEVTLIEPSVLRLPQKPQRPIVRKQSTPAPKPVIEPPRVQDKLEQNNAIQN